MSDYIPPVPSLLASASRADKYEINADVVYGLLARTYLQVGEWKLAAEYAEKAAKAKYAEAFEVCEYGVQPNEAEIKRLFPMLIK